MNFQTTAQTTSAPNSAGKELVISLEKRAAALLQVVRKVLDENRMSHSFLLQGIEHQAVLVEALALDLGRLVQSKDIAHQIHHIHVIEEDLVGFFYLKLCSFDNNFNSIEQLFLENRVSEEIAIFYHFRDGNHTPNGETTAQLIARGERLVKEAKEAVAKFPKAKEVAEINSSVIVVEALLKAIQARPAPTPDDLKKDETELARQEKSLRQLIEKATHRGH